MTKNSLPWLKQKGKGKESVCVSLAYPIKETKGRAVFRQCWIYARFKQINRFLVLLAFVLTSFSVSHKPSSSTRLTPSFLPVVLAEKE